ncbi:hypothetical protein HYALB_00005641 [Hymenoscyphus albidus]|uniref:Uncharacterized protein n=1 Tax=Hymenoscyphus albidus TaxID=595503 RepID=A0A9N9LKT3_9HELO|nr:hypothetical protein HYALB_00005641 [Hymenoscyphus albidus]
MQAYTELTMAPIKEDESEGHQNNTESIEGSSSLYKEAWPGPLFLEWPCQEVGEKNRGGGGGGLDTRDNGKRWSCEGAWPTALLLTILRSSLTHVGFIKV